MSKLTKIIVIVAAVIVILLLAGYFALRSFLTPTYMRTIAQKMASEAIQRPVQIGRVGMRISFGIGITIDDISIPNTQEFSAEPMMEIGKTTLSVKLLPLLSRRVVISSITLDGVMINLERNRNKELNFAVLIPRETKGARWNVSLAELEIKKSELRYSDALTRSQYVVSDINQKVRFRRNKIMVSGKLQTDIPKSKNLPSLQINLNNALEYDTVTKSFDIRHIAIRSKPVQLNVSGKVVESTVLDLKGELAIKNISELKELIPRESRPEGLSGAVKADLTITGTTNEPKIDGRCEINNVSVTLKGMTRPVEKIDGEFAFGLSAIRNMIIQASIGNTVFNIEGGVSSLNKRPLLDISAVVDGDLKDFEGLTNDLKDISLSGSVASDITLKGTIDNLRYLGNIKISGARIEGIGMEKPVSNLNLTGTFQEKMLRISTCNGNIGRSDFSFGAEVSNFEKPIIQLKNRSKYIDLDELLPKTKKGQQPKGKPLPMTLRGSVSITKLTGMDMEFKNINTDFEYKNGIIDVKNCRAETFDGQVYLDFYYNANSPEPYQIATRMQSVAAEKILQRFLHFDRLKGDLSGQADFQGKGLDQRSVLSNLNATGNLKFFKGEFSNFPFLTKLLAWLGLKDYKNVQFNNLLCSFKIADGKTDVQDWTFSARVGDFLTSGRIGLNGNLDLRVAATLSKQHSGIVKKYHGDWIFFDDKQGRTVVDIIVSGSFASPVFKLDRNRVKERLSGKIKDEFKKKAKDFEDQLKNLYERWKP